jgi:hypothetical protein
VRRNQYDCSLFYSYLPNNNRLRQCWFDPADATWCGEADAVTCYDPPSAPPSPPPPAPPAAPPPPASPPPVASCSGLADGSRTNARNLPTPKWCTCTSFEPARARS